MRARVAVALGLLLPLIVAAGIASRIEISPATLSAIFTTPLTTDTTYYVSQTQGSDSNNCTASGTSACATIFGVESKIPKTVNAWATVSVACGSYDGGAEIVGHSFGLDGGIVFAGTMSNVSLDGGSNTGTLASVTTGAVSGFSTATVAFQSPGFTSGELVGSALVITSGTGVGYSYPIVANDAGTISTPGTWVVAPTAASGYAVQQSCAHVASNVGAKRFDIPATSASTPATALGAAFYVQNDITLRDVGAKGTTAPAVTIKGFDFTGAAVQHAVVASSDVAVVENWFSSGIANAGIRLISAAKADVERNVVNIGNVRFLHAGVPGDGVIAGLQAKNNYLADCNPCFTSGATLAYPVFTSNFGGNLSGHLPYRLSTVLDGLIYGDYWGNSGDGSASFLRTPFDGLGRSGTGTINIEAVTVTGATSPILSLSGRLSPVIDRLGLGNSTLALANASNAQLIIANGGPRIEWGSGTTWTPGGSSTSDIQLNDTDVNNYTLAAFRTLAPRSKCTSAGTCIFEAGSSVTSASSCGSGFCFTPTATGSLPTVSATLEGYGGYDSTVDRVAVQGQDGTPAYHYQARTDNETFTGTTTLSGPAVASDAKNKGTLTLSGGGTQTATVTSGAICICSETTDATKTVKCAVSSTTLTATGTPTDVIAYHCF